MEFEYLEEYKYPTRICLNLTDDCNLACKYCFVEQNPHYMTYDIAKKAVDFIVENHKIKNLGKKERCFLNFFGGEPTLMWDSIIVPLTNYIRLNNFPINLAMTTNGTLLTKERIEFLKANKINILLSMDGNFITQNFNRPCRNINLKSFDMVEKNISTILKNLPKTTFRATVYAPTAKYLYENFLFAGQNNFKSIYLGIDERHPWTSEEIQNLYLNLDKIFSFYDYCFSNNLSIPIDFRQMTKMFINIRKYFENNNKSFDNNFNVKRCGLGTTLSSVGYDGKIYGCQEQTSKIDKNIFLIGDIFSGIDIVAHENLLKTYFYGDNPYCTNKNLCLNCIRFCEGNTCPSTSLDVNNNFFERTEIVCLFDQYIYKNCLILFKKYMYKNNLSFDTYLKNYCNYKIVEKEGEIDG